MREVAGVREKTTGGEVVVSARGWERIGRGCVAKEKGNGGYIGR